jgi:hypothetical protein
MTRPSSARVTVTTPDTGAVAVPGAGPPRPRRFPITAAVVADGPVCSGGGGVGEAHAAMDTMPARAIARRPMLTLI